MTYPNQPPYPPQPGFAPQGYAPPVPGYGPPPPGYAPQGYAPQGYAPQGYAPQQPPQGPAPVLARGTLEDWMDQAGGGSPSVTKFFTNERPQGSWLHLQIARDLINSDVQQQTDNNDKPAVDKQGRPKFVLIIPVQVLASSDPGFPAIFTEGTASVWIKGVTKDAFLSAMSTAGVQTPDRALTGGKLGGAQFVMQSNGTRAPRNAQYSPTKLYNFTYTSNGRENSVAAPVPPDPTAQLQQVAQAASGFAPVPTAPAASAPPMTPTAPTFQPPFDPAQYAQQAPQMAPPPGYPNQPQIAAPAAPPAPATPQMPPTPGAPVPGAPAGYQAYPGAPAIPDPAQQYAQQQAPQGYAPQAPPQPPQMGYAPPQDQEKAALLAKLQGQGG